MENDLWRSVASSVFSFVTGTLFRTSEHCCPTAAPSHSPCRSKHPAPSICGTKNTNPSEHGLNVLWKETESAAGRLREPPVDCRIKGRRRAADAVKYWTTWWRLGTSDDTSSRPEAAVPAGVTEREASHHVLQNGMGKVLSCSLVLQLTQTKPYGWNSVPAELLAGGRLRCMCCVRTDSPGDSLLRQSDMFGFTCR